MTTAEIAHIRREIAHYDAQAQNWTKPEHFRAMARLSASELRYKLGDFTREDPMGDIMGRNE